MSIIKIDPVKAQAQANAERIIELKRLLAETDYKVMPDYDKQDKAILAQRQAWRDELRSIALAPQ